MPQRKHQNTIFNGGWEKRRCDICGAKLSIHNHKDICFHHPEHEDYEPAFYILPSCTSYFNWGLYKAIYDYEGFYNEEE